jgi:Ca2+-dependent lipid-binding protein
LIMGILTIFLDKITNLRDADFEGNSDPYVKFELEQNNLILADKDYGEKKSSIKKDDPNPVYEETFSFYLPTIKNMVLTCRVFDDDQFIDGRLGKCRIDLDELALDSAPIEIRRKIDSKIFGKDATIHLTISYTE